VQKAVENHDENADNQPYSVDFLWTGKKLEKDAARVLRGRAPRQ